MPRPKGSPNSKQPKQPTEREKNQANNPNNGTKSTPQKRGGITVWPKRPPQK